MRGARAVLEPGAAFWRVALVAVGMLGSTTARADDVVSEPVHVDFEASVDPDFAARGGGWATGDACPRADTFFEEVQGRAVHARLAREGEPGRVLLVRIVRDPKGVRGELTIHDSAGTTAGRSVTGETCTEVASALALIAALSIDPNAGRSASAPATAPPPPPPVAPPLELTPVVPHVLPREAPLARRVPAARWRFSVGAEFAGEAVSAPDIAAAPVLFFDIGYHRLERAGPSLRFALTTFSGNSPNSGLATLGPVAGPVTIPGTASLRWIVGEAQGCPFALSAGAVSVRPCATFDVGGLRATGQGVDITNSSTRPWVTAGLLGRVEWALWDRLVLEAQLGGAIPFFRDQFVFDPGIPVYKAPAAVAVLGVGAAVRFPMIGARPAGHCKGVGEGALTLDLDRPAPIRPELPPAPSETRTRAAARSGTRDSIGDSTGDSARDSTRDRDQRLRGLMSQNFDFIWRSLRRLGLDADGADDGAQKVFMIAARKLSAIDVGSERSFLFSTALRVASEARRTIARRHEVLDDAPDATDPAPRADELLDARRARQALDDVLSAMALDLRIVFVLYELEEMTSADIAALLEIPIGTASSRLRRAREEFQSIVKRMRARHGWALQQAQQGSRGGSQ